MKLWDQWYNCVRKLQPACSRSRTFLFLVLVLIGFSIRPESAGVTSFIRAVFLDPGFYKGFLHFFNYSHTCPRKNYRLTKKRKSRTPLC